MKKFFRRAISLLMVAAILATGLVTVLGSVTAFATEVETEAAEVVTEEWFYDFKSGTGTDSTMPAFMKAHPSNYGSGGNDLNNWMTYKSDLPEGGKQTYFDENGLHYYSYYGSSAYNLDATNGTSWMRGFFLWDADVARQNANVRTFSDGKFGDGSVRNTFPDTADDANLYVTYGFGPDPTNTAGLVALDNGLYSVSVKFKVSEMNTSTGEIYIGVCVTNYATRGGDYNLSYQNYMFDRAIITDVMDDWATLTVFVDGSLFKGEGKNYLKVGISNDKFVADGTYNQVDFESIKVKRLYDETNDETGIRYALTNAFTGGKMQSVDVPGFEPVLMSGNGSVVLPSFETGSATMQFYRWEPYDVSENFYTNYSGIDGYHSNNTHADKAMNYLTTYPGATFTPGAGAFALAARARDAIAVPTTTTEYVFDGAGLYENKDGLIANGNSSFMSTGIQSELALNADGELVIADASGGSDAWFENQKPYEHIGAHRIGFYTGADKSEKNKGDWWYNSLQFKNGYTYKVEMTFKFEHTGASESKSLNIGIGYPIISGNYWTWSNVNIPLRWRYTTETEGFVTVEGSFEGDIYNEGHFAAIVLSTNSHSVTIKSLKITETFVGTVSTIEGETKVGSDLGAVTIPESTETVNGLVNDTDGGWFADKECTIPVTAFNSKVRKVYAKTDKVFDVEGTENGNIITAVSGNDVIVKVAPNNGYKLAAGGLVATVNGNKVPVIFKNGQDADGQGTGLEYILKDVDQANISAMDVEFVANNALSLDVIAASIRTSDNGLRFRGRVAKGVEIDEVGFVLLPAAMLNGELTIDTNKAVIARTAFDDVVYDETGAYKDFQVRLTGLADKMLDAEIACAMFVRVGDTYTYSNISRVSYNQILAAYNK